MKRRTVVATTLVLALACTAVAAAMPERRVVGDRVCAQLRTSRNPGLYPSLAGWVWLLPDGCVFTTDRPLPAGCTRDPDLGCAAPPNVHVRFRGRDYVFHLTMRGVSAKARGIVRAAASRRLLVAHDGKAASRQRLFVTFSAAEFDGLLDSGPSQGQPDLGPGLVWIIEYTLDRRKGLCCPRVDPGSPEVSPFDIAPRRVVTLPSGG